MEQPGGSLFVLSEALLVVEDRFGHRNRFSITSTSTAATGRARARSSLCQNDPADVPRRPESP